MNANIAHKNMNFFVRLPRTSSAKKWKAGDKENGPDHTRTQICKRENTFRGVKKGFFVCLSLSFRVRDKSVADIIKREKEVSETPPACSPAVQRKMEIWNKKGGGARMMLAKNM